MGRQPEKVEIVKSPFARANAHLGLARSTMAHSVHEARLGNYSKSLSDVEQAINELTGYRETIVQISQL